MMPAARLVWLLAGAAWAALSLLQAAHPDYWDPVTTLDWGAIWLYSAAWLLMAPAVVLLGWLAVTRQVRAVATFVACAAVLAGGSNAMEDGLGAEGWGTPYVVGFIAACLGLIALAAMLKQARHTRLAGIAVGLFLGVMLFTLGGGLIVLVTLGSLAVRPQAFTVRDPEPAPGVAAGPVGGG